MDDGKKLNKKGEKMKQIIFAAIALLLVGLVSGSSSLEGQGLWTNWKSDEESTGLYSNNAGIIRNQTKYTTIGTGSSYEHMTADSDGDGDVDIFGTSGNILKVYGLDSSNNIVLQGERNIGLPQSQAGALVQLSSGDYRVITPVAGGGSHYLYSWSYNGSALAVVHDTMNVTASGNPGCIGFSTVMKCTDFFGSEPTCIWMCKSGSHHVFYKYSPHSNTLSWVNNTYSGYPLDNVHIALDDWDADSNLEIAYVCEANAWHQSLCVADLTTAGRECTIDMGSLLSTRTHVITDVAFYDVDGGAYTEALAIYSMTVSSPCGIDSSIKAFNIACGGAQSYTIKSCSSCPNSVTSGRILAGSFTSIGDKQVCGHQSGCSDNNLKCFAAGNGSVVADIDSLWVALGTPDILAGFDADDDNRLDMLTSGNYLIYPYDQDNFSITSCGSTNRVLSDVTGDSKAEIIGSTGGTTCVTVFDEEALQNTTVIVRDVDTSSRLEGALVCIGSQCKTTDSQGEANFNISTAGINATLDDYLNYVDVDLATNPREIYLDDVEFDTLDDDEITGDTYTLTRRASFHDYADSIGHHGWGSGALALIEDTWLPETSFWGDALKINSTIVSTDFYTDSYNEGSKTMFQWSIEFEDCDSVPSHCKARNETDFFLVGFRDYIGNDFASAVRMYATGSQATNWTIHVDLGNRTTGVFTFSEGSTDFINDVCSYTLPGGAIDPITMRIYLDLDTESVNLYITNVSQNTWELCTIGDFVQSVNDIDYISVLPSLDNEMMYLYWINAYDFGSAECADNGLPQITSVTPDTGQPACPGTTVTYAVEYVDADGDQAAYRYECYDWTSGNRTSWVFSDSPILIDCDYNSTGSYAAIFEVTDLCEYPSLTHSWIYYFQVSATNCYDKGEGVFEDEELSDIVPGLNITISDPYDGYHSSNFDFSSCSSWQSGWRALIWWICPLLLVIAAVAIGIFNFIFSAYFGVVLIIILVVILVALVKRRKR
jgi:hypothetical protein